MRLRRRAFRSDLLFAKLWFVSVANRFITKIQSNSDIVKSSVTLKIFTPSKHLYYIEGSHRKSHLLYRSSTVQLSGNKREWEIFMNVGWVRTRLLASVSCCCRKCCCSSATATERSPQSSLPTSQPTGCVTKVPNNCVFSHHFPRRFFCNTLHVNHTQECRFWVWNTLYRRCCRWFGGSWLLNLPWHVASELRSLVASRLLLLLFTGSRPRRLALLPDVEKNSGRRRPKKRGIPAGSQKPECLPLSLSLFLGRIWRFLVGRVDNFFCSQIKSITFSILQILVSARRRKGPSASGLGRPRTASAGLGRPRPSRSAGEATLQKKE